MIDSRSATVVGGKARARLTTGVVAEPGRKRRPPGPRLRPRRRGAGGAGVVPHPRCAPPSGFDYPREGSAAAHGDLALHPLILMAVDRAIPRVLAWLSQVGPEGGGLAGLNFLRFHLAFRTLDLEGVDRLACVRHLEVDDSRLLDPRVGRFELELGLADVDRGDRRLRRRL